MNYDFFYSSLEEIAKLSEVFTSSTSSSESKTHSSSRRLERTSIRTYYSNADLTTQYDHHHHQQHQHSASQQEHNYGNDYAKTIGLGHQREFEKNRFGSQQCSTGTGSPDSLRPNLISTRDARWMMSPETFRGPGEFRVRSPSLPPIGSLSLK